MEFLFQQLFNQTLCIPTLAVWGGFVVSSEWRLRDAVVLGLFLLSFSYALYPESPQIGRMILAVASIGLGSVLSYRYALRPEVELIGALSLAMLWGLCMAWTLLTACGTLVCVAVFMLATARRTRQSRPAS